MPRRFGAGGGQVTRRIKFVRISVVRRLSGSAAGHRESVEEYAVGFARPDRWVRQGVTTDASRPWHAVEARRPVEELDGEVELAVCGAIVQVWGRQDWNRVGTGRTACLECQRRAACVPTAPIPQPTDGGRLRVVS
jgi:hypothetical protein